MSDVYVPGVCNIGAAEIGRRRRAGHVGVVVTVVLLAVLLWLDADRWWRLVLVLPAAGAASGYLQARLRFCGGFAARGVYNFGELGETERVLAEESQALDRRRARQILLGSLAIGVAVALLSLAL